MARKKKVLIEEVVTSPWTAALGRARHRVPKLGLRVRRQSKAEVFLSAVATCIELVQEGHLETVAYAYDQGIRDSLDFLETFFFQVHSSILDSRVRSQLRRDPEKPDLKVEPEELSVMAERVRELSRRRKEANDGK